MKINKSILFFILFVPFLDFVFRLLKPFLGDVYWYYLPLLIIVYTYFFFVNKPFFDTLVQRFINNWLFQWCLYWCLLVEQFCAYSSFFLFCLAFDFGLALYFSNCREYVLLSIIARAMLLIFFFYLRVRRSFLNYDTISANCNYTWISVLGELQRNIQKAVKQNDLRREAEVAFVQNRLPSKQHTSFPFLKQKRSMWRKVVQLGEQNPYDAAKVLGAAVSVTCAGTYGIVRDQQQLEAENARHQAQLEAENARHQAQLEAENARLQEEMRLQELQMSIKERQCALEEAKYLSQQAKLSPAVKQALQEGQEKMAAKITNNIEGTITGKLDISPTSIQKSAALLFDLDFLFVL